jgi:hypothetical protein
MLGDPKVLLLHHIKANYNQSPKREGAIRRMIGSGRAKTPDKARGERIEFVA